MKTETKHTPGPWIYYHDTCASCEKNGEKEFNIVGPLSGHHGQFTNEFDARLIAAAPELLVACTELVAEIEHLESTNGLCVPSLGSIEKMKAAIAKATGGEE